MTRTQKIAGGVAALGVVLSMAVGTAVATAQDGPARGGRFGAHHGERRGMPPFHMLGGLLDLTDAQKEQAKAIHEANRAALQQLAERSRTAREQVRAAIEGPGVNEQAIRSAVAAESAVDADRAVLHAKMRQQFLDILTPEQRAKAEKLQQERHQRMKERRKGRSGARAEG